MTAIVESYASPPANSSLVNTPSPLTIRTSPQTTGSDEDDTGYSSHSPHLAADGSSTRSRRLDGIDYQAFPWKFASEDLAAAHSMSINHKDVINFVKIDPRLSRMQHCVMCGRQDVHIPSQNKNVCKSCDSCFWLHHNWNVVIKFCKGCKNFFVLDEFQDKPEGTKCKKCRQRGRENYLQKKGQVVVTPSIDTAALLQHDDGHHHEFFPCGESPVSITSESDALSTGHKRGSDQIAALIQASNQSFFSTQAFASLANQVTPGNSLKKPPKMPKKTPTSSTSASMEQHHHEGGYFFSSHNSENCVNHSNPLINHPSTITSSNNNNTDNSSYGTPRVAKKAKFAPLNESFSAIKPASTPQTLTSTVNTAQLATPCAPSHISRNTPSTLAALQLPQSTPSYAHPVTPIIKADHSSNTLAPMKFIKLNINNNNNTMNAPAKYEYSKMYVDMNGAGRDDLEEQEERETLLRGQKPSLGRLDKLKKYSVLADVVAQMASPEDRAVCEPPTQQVGVFHRSSSTTSNLSCVTTNTSGHCSDDEAATTTTGRIEDKWQWDPSVNPLMQLALLTAHEQI